MCYSVYFSTDNDQDLTLHQAEEFSVSHLNPAYDAKNEKFLRHPYHWYLTSPAIGCCSCHFRHSIDWPEFVPLQDWFPEDEEDVESTRLVYDFIASIVKNGWKLDVVDIWEGYEEQTIPTVQVELSKVPRDHFRFFQDTRFEISE